MKRKLLSTILVVGILASSVCTGFANTASVEVRAVTSVSSTTVSSSSLNENSVKITKDRAKEIAVNTLKEYFDIQIDEKKYETRIELRQNYELQGMDYKCWDVNYQLNDNQRSISYNVSLDADNGDLVGFNKWEHTFNAQQTQAPAKITKDQAKKVAEDFIKKVIPKDFAELKYINDDLLMKRYGSNYPQNYSFRYMRAINGIEFDRNSVNIEISGADSKVVSFRKTWIKNPKLPELNGLMDSEKALEAFRQGMKINLAYLPNWSYGYDDTNLQVKLAYLPDSSVGSYLDAKDGKFIDWDGRDVTEQKIKDLTQAEKEAFLKKAKDPVKLDKEIDADKATEIAKNIIKETYNEEYDIESINYSDRNNGSIGSEKIWSAQFVKKGSIGYTEDRGYIQINAATGKLFSLDKYNYGREILEKFEPKLTWDEAYGKAIDMIAKYFPESIKEIKTEQRYSEAVEYYNNTKIVGRRLSFNFPRMINGIQDPVSNISITYDAATGSVLDMRCTWNDKVKYDEPKKAIKVEEATNIFFNNHEPKLTYIMASKDVGNGKTEQEIKAVYKLYLKGYEYGSLYGMASVDAISGKFIDFNGEEIKDEKDNFEETIKNHWAKDKLSILATGGIIDSKSFKIDESITKLEAVKMLVKAKGYSIYMNEVLEDLKFTDIKKEDGNYKYLQMAVKYGIIQNTEGKFNGHEKLTRLQMVELIVEQTAFKKLAVSGELFAVPFKDCMDVKKEKIGYIAVAKGLNICGGNSGKFRPADNTTMAEFAIAVYNSLEYIRN